MSKFVVSRWLVVCLVLGSALISQVRAEKDPFAENLKHQSGWDDETGSNPRRFTTFSEVLGNFKTCSFSNRKGPTATAELGWGGDLYGFSGVVQETNLDEKALSTRLRRAVDTILSDYDDSFILDVTPKPTWPANYIWLFDRGDTLKGPTWDKHDILTFDLDSSALRVFVNRNNLVFCSPETNFEVIIFRQFCASKPGARTWNNTIEEFRFQDGRVWVSDELFETLDVATLKGRGDKTKYTPFSKALPEHSDAHSYCKED